MKFEQILTGKAWRVEDKKSEKTGKSWQTFVFSYGKKQQDDSWKNVYINVVLFNDRKVAEGEILKLSGKIEPNTYERKDGTPVEGINFVAFDILESEGFKGQELDLDNLTDDELEEDEDGLPF